jgi:pimeloyl-ACP methyl ester carboxylesterase
MLLHGGGQSRRVWHENGYVTRLSEDFTVMTIDIRGHGESDRPSGIDAYSIDRISDDIVAAADAAQLNRFAVWGYSFGGNIARHLPAKSQRVSKIVIIGVGFGAAAPPPFREYALSLRAKWTPVIQAAKAGTLSLDSLPAQDRALWQAGTIPFTIDLLGAVLEWPSVEPEDIGCPTLWLVGTANENAMSSVNKYRGRLEGTKVVLQLLAELTHADEMTKVDEVLSLMRRSTIDGGDTS